MKRSSKISHRESIRFAVYCGVILCFLCYHNVSIFSFRCHSPQENKDTVTAYLANLKSNRDALVDAKAMAPMVQLLVQSFSFAE